MPGQTRHVQPIALLRSGTHDDAVAAAAVASVHAWLATPDDPAWDAWLGGPVAKSVRRARPVQFDAVRGTAAASATVGDAQALAFLPTTYDDLHPTLSKMQVDGTEMPRDDSRTVLPDPRDTLGTPVLVVNGDAGMSTGKTASQAAHGLFYWAMATDPDTVSDWRAAGSPVVVVTLTGAAFAEAVAKAPHVVQDAGFTEIPSGTTTVAVITSASADKMSPVGH